VNIWPRSRKVGEIGFGAWAIGVVLGPASLHVWTRRPRLDDNAVAPDALREVGPRRHFFGPAYALANYETAFWEGAVADNKFLEHWRDEGMKDAPRRASERCGRLLAECEQRRLDPAADEELNAFVSRRKAEQPDQRR
jgi:trimethylamine--corrinoid protein Co-methyltransferase